MVLVTFLAANFFAIVGAVTTVLSGLIAIALIIPGEHPDIELTAARDFLVKLSRK